MKNLVAIIGASEKVARYSHMAQSMLMDMGYPVLPVSPLGKEVLGVAGVKDLSQRRGEVDTVTLYIGSDRVGTVVDDVVQAKPRRVIFNPGTENESAKAAFEKAGIETLEACTLVMLRTGQF